MLRSTLTSEYQPGAVGRYDKSYSYLWSLMKIVRRWLATMECRLLRSEGMGAG